MKQSPNTYPKNVYKYKDGWLVLESGTTKILAFDKNLNSAMKIAREKGVKTAWIIKAPKEWGRIYIV